MHERSLVSLDSIFEEEKEHEKGSSNGEDHRHHQRAYLRRGACHQRPDRRDQRSIHQCSGGAVPAGAALVNAQGATLMPGLIDAHVHTSLDGLRDALAFGVTTELEMQGHWTDQDRKEVAEHDDIADIVLPGWASPLQADTPVNCFLKARTLVMMPTIIPPKTVRDTASSLHSHRPRRKRLISWTNSQPPVLTISRL